MVVVGRGDAASVITTCRLVVRPWRLDEADRFFDIYRRPEVVRWIGAEPMPARREGSELNVSLLTRVGADCSWAAVDRSRGVPVGGVGPKPLPDGEGEVEIAW